MLLIGAVKRTGSEQKGDDKLNKGALFINSLIHVTLLTRVRKKNCHNKHKKYMALNKQN